MTLSDVHSNDARGAKALADPTHPDFFLDNSPLYLMARIYGRYTFAMERFFESYRYGPSSMAGDDDRS